MCPPSPKIVLCRVRIGRKANQKVLLVLLIRNHPQCSRQHCFGGRGVPKASISCLAVFILQTLVCHVLSILMTTTTSTAATTMTRFVPQRSPHTPKGCSLSGLLQDHFPLRFTSSNSNSLSGNFRDPWCSRVGKPTGRAL